MHVTIKLWRPGLDEGRQEAALTLEDKQGAGEYGYRITFGILGWPSLSDVRDLTYFYDATVVFGNRLSIAIYDGWQIEEG